MYQHLFFVLTIIWFLSSVDIVVSALCGINQGYCEGYVSYFSKCYDLKTQQCIENNICGINEEVCNGQCYDPKQKQCIKGYLCGVNQGYCEGYISYFSKCYDLKTQQCIENNICGINEKVCNGKCYDPTQYKCTRAIYLRQLQQVLRRRFGKKPFQ